MKCRGAKRVLGLLLTAFLEAQPVPPSLEIHRITVDTSRVLKQFDPAKALGAGIDGHEKGEIARLYQPEILAAMRSAGLKPLTYRLRTELAGEAWHWNPKGRWSDPALQQGYWTSDSHPDQPIEQSYGYRLPRRGNTIDQANDDGFSRITDGSRDTFWKSNPYLGNMPQWVAIDFGKPLRLDAIKMAWGAPWAQKYKIQYSIRDAGDIDDDSTWSAVPLATQVSPNGGEVMTRFASLTVRKLRVVMEASSGSSFIATNDPRDRTGFAIREISAGTIDGAGRFHDLVRHAPNRNRQTVAYVSSTDPWHRALDRDENTEQPGFDRVFGSGLTSGRPMLATVGVLYDTPENAVAALEYLKSRHYPVGEIELGEEPEEQQIPAEMYGALYRRWAAALHKVDPLLRIGGPSLVLLAPDAGGRILSSWIARWVEDMRHESALDLIQFFSFEWYPFDDVCDPIAPQLSSALGSFRKSLDQLIQQGVPSTIPWYMTEYGYSAYSSRAEVDLPGAIFNVETVASFLTFGGEKAFLYGYEPGELLYEKPCRNSWGNNMLFMSGEPLVKMPTYYGAKLLTEQWAQPEGGTHQLFAASVDHPRVGVYALSRPDRRLSFLIVNRSATESITVQVPLQGQVDALQYFSAQYQWRAAGENGHPVRNLPPQKIPFEPGGEIVLPPYSITVVRGAE